MADKAPVPAPPVLDLEKMSFNDWLFDIEIWRDFVKERLTEKKVGSYLYQHLKGKALETVRNEVKAADILSENGAKLIIECLSRLYKKDESRYEYDTFGEFIKFQRPANMSIPDYIVEFNLRYQKFKSYAGKLPEAVLGYSILDCANLSQEKKEICRGTCSALTYDNMKSQIEKVCGGLSCSQLNPVTDKFSYSQNDGDNFTKQISIKTEPNDDLIAYNEHLNDPSQDVFYSSKENYKRFSQNRQSYNSANNRQSYNSAHNRFHNHKTSANQINPKDRHGHVMNCNFCKCIYHLYAICPYKHHSANFVDHETEDSSSNHSNGPIN